MKTAFDPAAVADQPIDEAAVQALKSLLDKHAVPQGGMSLEMVDGLFSALIAAPFDSEPAQFLPLVIAPGEWPSDDVAAKAHGLLARLWNHIGQRIEIDPNSDTGNFMPLLSFPAGLPKDPKDFADALTRFEFPLGAAWAGGFLHAVNLRLQDWEALEQATPDFGPCFGYLLRLVQIDADDAGKPPPPAEERVAMMAAMPFLLRALAAQKDAS